MKKPKLNKGIQSFKLLKRMKLYTLMKSILNEHLHVVLNVVD